MHRVFLLLCHSPAPLVYFSFYCHLNTTSSLPVCIMELQLHSSNSILCSLKEKKKMRKAIFTPSHTGNHFIFLIMFPSLFQPFGKLRRDPFFSFSLFLSLCVSMLSASCHCLADNYHFTNSI